MRSQESLLCPSQQHLPLHTCPTAWDCLKWASSCSYTTTGPPRQQEGAKPLMSEPLSCVGVIIDVVVHAVAMPLII